MKSLFILVFTLIICNISAQNGQIYFIGEKIKEERCPINQVRSKLDTLTDGSTEKTNYRTRCIGGVYFSNYKIIKILKGTFNFNKVEFYSAYCSEFGYQKPLNNQFVIIGLKRDKNEWVQDYIEKIYLVKDKWVLPYKSGYPFINYKKVKSIKFPTSQRIKINILEAFSETQYLENYDKPYYKKGKKYAKALYGFIL